MKQQQLLSEISFYTYEGMIRITYEDVTALDATDLIRALPGVTRVTNAGNSEESGQTTLKIKLLSQKTAKTAFKLLRDAAIRRYSVIKKLEIAANTIAIV